MLAVAVVAASFVAPVAPATGSEVSPEHADPCRSHPVCVRRVKRRFIAEGRRRAARRQHVRDAQWRETVRPYGAWLQSTAACESGGDFSTNTGNGFYGAFQFTISSWLAVGGRGLPHEASPLEQKYRAVRLLGVQGRGAWPVCG